MKKFNLWSTLKTACLGALLLIISASQSQAASMASVPDSIPLYDQKNIQSRGFFYVGGEYVGEPGKELMRGQMYVEVFVPKKVNHKYPLVFFHGAGQTGTNWMGTPDGRKGWADYFIDQGYIVYIVDQPARGRSAYHPTLDGKTRVFNVGTTETSFTSTKGTWMNADKHTQWPGTGLKGDATFDTFYATQVESIASHEETQKLIQNAGAQLLDKIGPAILVTHSQAGPFGWLIADVRPDKVKGILALEPTGPPFKDAPPGKDILRPWGIASIPLTYDPPVKDASELKIAEYPSDKPTLLVGPGTLQEQPARQLPNLKGIPILIVSGEASFHGNYDEWTSRYLTQAGVKNTYIRLEDEGIKGNGHMLMVEKNSLEIAEFLNKWIKKNIE